MSAALPDYPVLDTRVLPPPPSGNPRDGVPVLRDPLVAGDPQVRDKLASDLEGALSTTEIDGDDLANFDFSATPTDEQDIDAEAETLLEMEAMPELAEEPVTDGDDFSIIQGSGEPALTAQIALDPAQLEALTRSVQSGIEHKLQVTLEATVRQAVSEFLGSEESPLKSLVADQVRKILNGGND